MIRNRRARADRFALRTRRLGDALSLLMAISAMLPGSVSGQDPIDRSLARAYFDEAEQLGREDGSALWGVPLHGPILFVDPATRSLVANRPVDALTERGGLYVGELPPDLNVANTSVSWAGLDWTMLVWPPPSLRHDRRRLLAHEMFHRIQDRLGLPARDPANAHLGERDGRIWTRLEWRALAWALLRRGPERVRALEDALAFRARRHSLFPEGAEEERALELNEGLAEYTGLRMSGLPDHVLADRAAVGLERRESRSNLARSFAYATGPAYGILLDETGTSWREDLGPHSDLATLTGRAYALDPPDGSEATGRAARYGGGRVIAEETARAERLEARVSALRERFLEGPTVTLRPGPEFRYSFNPNEVFPLPGTGNVYESSRVTDEWGVLTVESGGVLMVRSDRGIVRVVVPAPPDLDPDGTIAGDGWRLELAPGWTLRESDQPRNWIVTRR